MTVDADADLTVVLTLKDRAPFTARWFDYAQRVRLPFKVLVADGSEDDTATRMLAERSRYPDVDYEYIRYPHDATYADYYAKVVDVLSRVRTTHAVMADNDDFFAVDGLRRAAGFLAAHPDYVACGGQCLPFWIAPSETGAVLYGSRIDWKYSTSADTETSDSPMERVRNQSLGVNDVFYNVFRASQLHRQFEAIARLGPTDLFLVEHLISYLTAIAGKIHQLDCLYIARQQNSPGSSGGAHQQRYGGWWGRMLVPTWSRDFNAFIDVTAAELARAASIPVDEARAWMVKSYRLSVAPSLLSDVMEEETVTLAMPTVAGWVRRLVRLPESNLAKRGLRWLYRHSRWLAFESVYATRFRAVRGRGAAREFAAIAQFLERPQSSDRTSGT